MCTIAWAGEDVVFDVLEIFGYVGGHHGVDGEGGVVEEDVASAAEVGCEEFVIGVVEIEVGFFVEVDSESFGVEGDGVCVTCATNLIDDELGEFFR